MKVVNFDQKVFDSFLQKNLEKFLDENGNCLVVGIKEGGIPIAKMVVKQLQKESSAKIDFVSVTCQRPSTKRKKSNQLIKITLQKSFKILPQSILNRLRIIEYKYLLHKAENNSREITFPDNFDWKVYDKILVVDDAVDSGNSLRSVLEKIEQEIIIPKTNIISLTVVVTNKQSVIVPDYYLYSDILIRFPWSLDG
ncbi:phosphoribosyltransferase family protein [Empedobacter brevis]|uniref:phosphoribosyltransferase family protein n=1 Tax=Empedobacter brevis TaxID=247 RepID=UPI0028AC33E8|nr:phosphoribosyltransferase family protein [Empedobacter brevis]